MRRKFPLVLTLTAWLFATGSQWDLVQTFAWARMFAANVRTMPVLDAAKLTFSPEGRCEMCNAVATAKKQQENSSTIPSGKFDGKVILFYQPAPIPVIAAPEFSPWSLSGPMVGATTRAAPPVPPPRV